MSAHDRTLLRAYLTAGVLLVTALAIIAATTGWTWASHAATGLGVLVNVRWIWS